MRKTLFHYDSKIILSNKYRDQMNFLLTKNNKITIIQSLTFYTSWMENVMPKESGLSLMAVNPTYAFFSLDATGEIFLLLIEFTHKVTSLLRVWRTRLMVAQNIMTATCSRSVRFWSEFCNRLHVQVHGSNDCFINNHVVLIYKVSSVKHPCWLPENGVLFMFMYVIKW